MPDIVKVRNLPSASELTDDDFVPIDNANNGLRKIQLGGIISELKGSLNDLDLYVKGGLDEDDIIDTVSGYTIDLDTGKTKTGSTRQATFVFIPIKNADYVEVVCTDPSHTSSTDQAYKIFEYSSDSENAYLGGHPASTWYWIDANKYIYPSNLQYDGDYIRLAFYSLLTVTVKVHYSGRTTGGLKDDVEEIAGNVEDITTEIEDARVGVDNTGYNSLGESIRSQIANVSDGVVEAKGCYRWLAVGSISGSTGASDNTTTRCHTEDFIAVDDFLYFDMTEKSDYVSLLFFYAQDKSYIGRLSSAWANQKVTKADVLSASPNTKYIRFAIRRSDNSAISAQDFATLSNDIIFIKTLPGFFESDQERLKSSFDGQFNYIAYSKISGTGNPPILSDAHFVVCAEASPAFTALKGDVRPTKDNGLIMCHDTGYTFDSNNKIIAYNSSSATSIKSSLTVDDCKALTFADQYNGSDCHPIDFETYIRICKKNGKIAFVTIRDQYIESVVINAVLEVLKKYRMMDRTIINSMTPLSLWYFRGKCHEIMMCYTLNHNQAPTTDDVDMCLALGNCILNLFDVPVPSGGDLDTILTGYASVLDYAYSNGVIVYNAQSGNAHTDILMHHGIMGTHLTAFPDYNA